LVTARHWNFGIDEKLWKVYGDDSNFLVQQFVERPKASASLCPTISSNDERRHRRATKATEPANNRSRPRGSGSARLRRAI
jgi:hypothetical protein